MPRRKTAVSAPAKEKVFTCEKEGVLLWGLPGSVSGGANSTVHRQRIGDEVGAVMSRVGSTATICPCVAVADT